MTWEDEGRYIRRQLSDLKRSVGDVTGEVRAVKEEVHSIRFRTILLSSAAALVVASFSQVIVGLVVWYFRATLFGMGP